MHLLSPFVKVSKASETRSIWLDLQLSIDSTSSHQLAILIKQCSAPYEFCEANLSIFPRIACASHKISRAPLYIVHIRSIGSLQWLRLRCWNHDVGDEPNCATAAAAAEGINQVQLCPLCYTKQYDDAYYTWQITARRLCSPRKLVDVEFDLDIPCIFVRPRNSRC